MIVKIHEGFGNRFIRRFWTNIRAIESILHYQCHGCWWPQMSLGAYATFIIFVSHVMTRANDAGIDFGYILGFNDRFYPGTNVTREVNGLIIQVISRQVVKLNFSYWLTFPDIPECFLWYKNFHTSMISNFASGHLTYQSHSDRTWKNVLQNSFSESP